MNISDLTIEKLGEGLRSKNFSAKEITGAYFEEIIKKDSDIHAYLATMEDDAFARAEAVDKKIAEGVRISPLAGAPLAIKDNILVKGFQATAGSKILEGYRASYDAHVIHELKKADAVFLGKTNLDEFAMGTSTENSAFGPTKNPHDLERVPGGSSGGSAAAVASGMALGALGSDTGGSIRQPAAFCGIVGLKTTYGAVSRSGAVALASSLDQIGPLAKTVKDAALIFQTISGQDPLDATSVNAQYGDELVTPDFDKLKGLTVGVPKEYFIPGMAEEVEAGVRAAREKFESLGVKFKDISLPHSKYAVSTYYIILPAEASANLARFDGIRYAGRPELPNDFFAPRGRGFGAEPKRRIILGTFVLSAGHYDAYYKKAQTVRALLKRDFDEAFQNVDVILTPVTPSLPFKIGEKSSDPLQLYLEDVFTIPANLAGVPALSLPVFSHKERGASLPVGFQLIGRHFREADILGLGQLYER
jgi:aspartyl-tRNA(Asn)/glutamyl-tRNA(Gln) amidotransferase subunit A